jgi:hypothetical protein
VTVLKVAPAPVYSQPSESPYGTFGAKQETSDLASYPSYSAPALQSFNEADNPYGYFGNEDALSSASPFQTPRGGVASQSTSNGLGPSHSPHAFTFQTTSLHTEASLSEENYGCFDPDSDQIHLTASLDIPHVAPSFPRSISESIPKSWSTDPDVFPNAPRLFPSKSHRVITSTSAPSLNRLMLSSYLDDSSHLAWKEGKHAEAFEVTNTVHNEIKSYLANIRSSSERRVERSSSEGDPLVASELIEWIPSTAASDDLRLLAKTLAQKGDIQKVLPHPSSLMMFPHRL